MTNNNTERILTPYQVNNLELLIDLTTGEVFASQRGLARLCGKALSTIQHWILTENISNQSFKAKYSKGLILTQAHNEQTIAMALEKYNPRLLLQCQRAGLRVFLHGLVGLKYEVKTDSQDKSPNTHSKALEAAKFTREIADLWQNDNPRLAQYLIDHCLNEVLNGHLPGKKEKDDRGIGGHLENPLLGVVEIAEDMGFKCTISNRSILGKHVAKICGHLAQYDKRLCNGRMTKMKVYPDCLEVREAIKSYFD